MLPVADHSQQRSACKIVTSTVTATVNDQRGTMAKAVSRAALFLPAGKFVALGAALGDGLRMAFKKPKRHGIRRRRAPLDCIENIRARGHRYPATAIGSSHEEIAFPVAPNDRTPIQRIEQRGRTAAQRSH